MRYDLGHAGGQGLERQRILSSGTDREEIQMRVKGPLQFSGVWLLVAVLLLLGVLLLGQLQELVGELGELVGQLRELGDAVPQRCARLHRAYVKSGGRIEEFKRRLGELAKERGITDWEENMATYEGIGRGLGKAKASQVELETYTTNLAGGDPKKAKAIKDGYDAEKDVARGGLGAAPSCSRVFSHRRRRGRRPGRPSTTSTSTPTKGAPAAGTPPSASATRSFTSSTARRRMIRLRRDDFGGLLHRYTVLDNRRSSSIASR